MKVLPRTSINLSPCAMYFVCKLRVYNICLYPIPSLSPFFHFPHCRENIQKNSERERESLLHSLFHYITFFFSFIHGYRNISSLPIPIILVQGKQKKKKKVNPNHHQSLTESYNLLSLFTI